MFQIVEPQWGMNLLLALHGWMMSDMRLIYRIPKLADIFVFVYPVFFVFLYAWGFLNHRFLMNHVRGLYYKVATMFIVFSGVVAVIVNILIQYVVDKVRPNVTLRLIDHKTESILHNYLPSSSFPSDHAAISMAFAVVTLVRGLSKKDRRFVWMSIPLFVFSLTMSFCRITAAIHRPTDIIAGSLVGILVPLVVMKCHSPSSRLEKVFVCIGKKI